MWNAAITNEGAALLTRWAGGGTLIVEGASASTGLVDVAALMACTALSGEEHRDVKLVNGKAMADGMRYDIQFTAVETAYIAHQVGVWAKMEGDVEAILLAIFQDEDGIAVQSIAAMPNFIYSFKAIVAIDNAGKLVTVTDSGALVCWEDLREALASIKIEVAETVTEDGTAPVTGAAVYAFVEAAVPKQVPASNVTAGTLAGQVQANEAAAAVLSVAQLRNIVMTDVDPGEGAEVDYPDGTVIHVYE